MANKTNDTKKKEGKKFGASIVTFFKDVRSELKKVIFPSRKQIITNTTVVLVMCAVLCAFIYVFDIGFGLGSRAVLGNKAADLSGFEGVGNDYTIDENGSLVPNNSGFSLEDYLIDFDEGPIEDGETPEGELPPEGGLE